MFRKEYERILEELDNVSENVDSPDVKEMISEIYNIFDSLYFEMNYELEQRKDDIRYMERYIEDLKYRGFY